MEWALNERGVAKIGSFQPISRRISEAMQDRTVVTIDGLIGNRISAFDWYQNHRPWMTLNGQYA